ncbi:hypothetical protein JCM19037_4152 [Geomicrobium sp. JCM 19037]|nr:hypothetical protein JCM19037_4152 [Geomicrobium sp. JCM 19037]
MASHKDTHVPMRDGSKMPLKKGQLLTSLTNISNGVGHKYNNAFIKPDTRTIKRILEWIESNEMIVIEKGRKGRQYHLITIKNWEAYQIEEKPPPVEDTKSVSQPKNKKDPKPQYDKENTYYKMASYFKSRIDEMAKSEGLGEITKRSNMQTCR